MPSSLLLLPKAHWTRGEVTNRHLSEVLPVQPGIWNHTCQFDHIVGYTRMTGSMNFVWLKMLICTPKLKHFDFLNLHSHIHMYTHKPPELLM